MKIPENLTFQEAAYAFDGGSIMLILKGSEGQDYDFTLAQHAFREPEMYMNIPGRLYFDGNLIGIRSKEEEIILKIVECFLKAEEQKVSEEEVFFEKDLSGQLILGEDIKGIMSNPHTHDIKLLKKFLNFIRSEEYIEFSKKVKIKE